jgi:hypothetical protein
LLVDTANEAHLIGVLDPLQLIHSQTTKRVDNNTENHVQQYDDYDTEEGNVQHESPADTVDKTVAQAATILQTVTQREAKAAEERGAVILLVVLAEEVELKRKKEKTRS